MERLSGATDKLNKELKLEYKVPWLLIIDTPGHEQFTNLRSRGSSLCDIAVLVVDIMHGLERQTIESINLLRQRKTPCVVALNTVDRMYGWKPQPGAPIRETLAVQADYAQAEFETRTQRVLVQLAEQGLNASLYYDNKDFRRNVSVVPTSAVVRTVVPTVVAAIALVMYASCVATRAPVLSGAMVPSLVGLLRLNTRRGTVKVLDMMVSLLRGCPKQSLSCRPGSVGRLSGVNLPITTYTKIGLNSP
jgi:hypothetical protein